MLIAEIGLCHFGSLKIAKELVLAARDCGADAVKTQYVEADEVAKYGSLPIEFYRSARLSHEESQELYDFARFAGIPLFFSYFAKSAKAIGDVMKFSAKQSEEMSVGVFAENDSDKSIFSLNRNFPTHRIPLLQRSTVMYASDYMSPMPLLGIIDVFSGALDRAVGYSDHSISPDVARIAARDHKLLCLEKHFFIGEVQKFNGQVIRDTVHAARPNEFSLIASTYKKYQSEESKQLVHKLFPSEQKKCAV